MPEPNVIIMCNTKPIFDKGRYKRHNRYICTNNIVSHIRYVEQEKDYDNHKNEK